jgi:protein-disulfide isomerase
MSHHLKSLFFAASVSAALTMTSVTDLTAAEKPFSATKISEIEKLVHDYIMTNPQVILDAVRAHQVAEEANAEAERQRKLVSMRDQLENAPTSPVSGNLNGDVTIVEFFDYRCGYCKRVHDTVIDTVKDDGNVRLVYKEFPILGPESIAASRAALGVFFNSKEKYVPFNDALMRSRGNLNEARVLEIAESIGLDPELVKKNMEDPRVNDELANTMALAEALNIRGTPAFVVNQTLVPGAVDAATLEGLIKSAREK